ncbi:MAG: hypothetical protein R3C01_13710 [Planctomycetaceae bacterium]
MRPATERRLNALGSQGPRQTSVTSPVQRGGFTLVEMLVSTLLVVIILLMFAQMFQSATGTMGQQRALALNDQRARLVSTVIRNDLANMTYGEGAILHAEDLGLSSTAENLIELSRGIVPIQNGDPVYADQRGFVRIDERGSEDILHFTVMIDAQNGELPYIGKATSLGAATDLNQPDMDDGVSGNEAGSSRAAEIVIFLRDGVLYRRQLLLRDPQYQLAPRFDEQPKAGAYGVGTNFATFQTVGNDFNYTAGNSFWNDFDYSAYREDIDGDSMTPGDEIRFNGISSLDNSRGASNRPIAIRAHRFPRDGATGQPFTMQETSDPAFTYPGTGTTKVGSVGTRQGEDILLTNVDAFDVKVWKPTTDPVGNPAGGAFVDLGASGTIYSGSNTFDTWHPLAVGAPTRPLLQNSSTTTVAMFATGTAYNVDDVVFTGSANDPVVYLCIQAGTSGTDPPSWPGVVGAFVADGGAKWLAIDNRVGIKMIQVTIRYRDLATDQPRQVTIVHSFLE